MCKILYKESWGWDAWKALANCVELERVLTSMKCPWCAGDLHTLLFLISKTASEDWHYFCSVMATNPASIRAGI
jgi:hypothetical protein